MYISSPLNSLFAYAFYRCISSEIQEVASVISTLSVMLTHWKGTCFVFLVTEAVDLM